MTRLKFYHDSYLNWKAIMLHVLSPRNWNARKLLIGLAEGKSGILVQVSWRSPSYSEDTMEPLRSSYEDVPQLVKKLLQRKKIQNDLRRKAQNDLHLYKK